MNLYLLRHGLAADESQTGKDADRPLTSKGKRKLRKIAQALEALQLQFELILSSPYLRARQTAEIVAEALNAKHVLELTDCLTPHGDTHELFALITSRKPIPRDVLLVGHEPYLSELISVLVSGSSSLAVVMKKAGLCKLSADSLKVGRCASLEWLLTPKQLRLMR